jgi:nucleotide-binding universal stress UspA family protein
MTTAHRIATLTESKIAKIAVLTDFSPAANTALRYAATLARSYGAGIVLAHAYLPPSCACYAPETTLVFETLDSCRENLKDRLINLTHEPWLKDIRCTISLCLGGPADLLEELDDADVIVVGTSGETGLRKTLLGSTAEMVFRTSSKPVLTVGPQCHCTSEGKAAMGTVLCAVDFSSGAAGTLADALSIVRQNDSKLLLLHVVEEPGIDFALEQACARAEVLQELCKLMPEDAACSTRTQYLVDFGDADSAILKEAHAHNADLIVMGAHRTIRVPALASRFAGGTAYSVAANSECPVLTIPSANGLALDVTGITESGRSSD